MGGICLRQQPVLGEIDEDNSIWRIVSKSGTRTIDPMLPLIKDVSHIELFDLLQEPVAQTALGNYANTIERDHVLMCWAEIQQFKGEAAPTLRSLQAVEIYENYVKAGSPMRLREVSEILDDTYRKLLEPQLSRADRQRVQSDGNDGDVFHASFFAEVF